MTVFVSLAKDEEGDEERKKERIHSKTICQCGALIERWLFIAVEEFVEGSELVRRVPMSWLLVLRRWNWGSDAQELKGGGIFLAGGR